MADIWIRQTSEIQVPLPTMPADGPFSFSLCHSEQYSPITVTVAAPGDCLEATTQARVSEPLLSAFEEKRFIHELPKELCAEICTLLSALGTSSKYVLRLIVQELQSYERHTQFNSTTEWSRDGSSWSAVHGGWLSGGFLTRPIFKLNHERQTQIQGLVDAGEEPLLATEHLHAAERAEGHRSQWIEATIAAELAIKEILIRLEPKLETLLLEVPAPSLRKLYGSVLEAAAGSPSPYANRLEKGAEVRNKLIHRPQAYELDTQKVIDYVSLVGEAVRHLLELQPHRRAMT